MAPFSARCSASVPHWTYVQPVGGDVDAGVVAAADVEVDVVAVEVEVVMVVAEVD